MGIGELVLSGYEALDIGNFNALPRLHLFTLCSPDLVNGDSLFETSLVFTGFFMYWF
jgi:hypothetical protein